MVSVSSLTSTTNAPVIQMRIAFFLQIARPFPEYRPGHPPLLSRGQIPHAAWHNFSSDLPQTRVIMCFQIARISRIPVLKLKVGGIERASSPVLFMLLCIGAGCRIDFFQLSDGKRCLCGIFSGIILIKINQIRLSALSAPR